MCKKKQRRRKVKLGTCDVRRGVKIESENVTGKIENSGIERVKMTPDGRNCRGGQAKK